MLGPKHKWQSKKDFLVYCVLELNFSFPILEVMHFFYNKPRRRVKSMANDVEEVSYKFMNEYHNEDGPALISKVAGITIVSYHYYQGQLHSEKGPAYQKLIVIELPTVKIRKEWYIRGILMGKEKETKHVTLSPINRWIQEDLI